MGWLGNLRAALSVAQTTQKTVPPTSEAGYAVPNTGTLSNWWPYSAEKNIELVWPLSVVTYDKMRRQDAQIKAVLRAVTMPILATPWWIDDNGADPAVVALVANDLGLPVHGQPDPQLPRMRDRFSMPQHLKLALTMLTFGHSVFEQVYRLGDDGMFHLRKLGWRPPWTIQRFEVAADGGLIAIQQRPAAGASGSPVIPVSRLVVYVNELEGGQWQGQSALRPAYKNWLLKDMLLRIQTQSADRNGMGVVVYEGAEVPDLGDPQAMIDQQKKDLEAGLEIAKQVRSGDSAGAAVANGASLDLKGVTGDLPDLEGPIRYHDEQIAASMLAHFLNLGQQTGTGSYALGSVFADLFSMAEQGTATEIADVFTAHVIEDLVDANFGPGVRAPRLGFDDIGAKHVPSGTDLAQLVAQGVLWKGPQLEEFVRTMYGIPAETTQETT